MASAVNVCSDLKKFTRDVDKNCVKGDLIATEEFKETEELVVRKLGTDLTYTHRIMWKSVFFYIIMHIFAFLGLYRIVTGCVPVSTVLWSVFYLLVNLQGVYMGAHRYFSHKSFKAKPLLKILILFMNTTAGQNSAYIWARDHRQHHRYSDTDADPHNSKRGFFYSHVGWQLTSRHPLCKEMRKTIDVSDLKSDKLVMWQFKYFLPLHLFCGVLLPLWVPMYFFNETFANAFFVSYALRYVLCLHNTFLVNSVAHMYGPRPYDKNIQPRDSWLVSFLTMGEGWHNYHHAFPWDYKTAEVILPFQITTSLIKFLESVGLAFDLKTVSAEMLHNRIKRSGDGTREQVLDPTDIYLNPDTKF